MGKILHAKCTTCKSYGLYTYTVSNAGSTHCPLASSFSRSIFSSCWHAASCWQSRRDAYAVMVHANRCVLLPVAQLSPGLSIRKNWPLWKEQGESISRTEGIQIFNGHISADTSAGHCLVNKLKHWKSKDGLALIPARDGGEKREGNQWNFSLVLSPKCTVEMFIDLREGCEVCN